MIVARLNGRNLFHVKYIKLSYRIRGRVARTHTNRVANAIVFIISWMSWKIGISPDRSVAVSNLINKILAYSAIKINANIPALYSTLNPDTNSDSPSAKSNGVRFVSARFVINHIMARGIIKRDAHVKGFIIFISIDLCIINTESKIRDIDTS